MKKCIMIPAIFLAVIFGLMILMVGSLLAYLTFTEYKPSRTEKIENKGKGIIFPGNQKTFSFFSWNIGYGGQGKDMDFFYEGGKRVRPEKQEFLTCLQGIQETLSQYDTLDFILLQEVDIDSKRSYNINELDSIAGKLHGYTYGFAKNYDCRYIPVPLYDPIGEVVAGLAFFSKFIPESIVRNAYTVNFPWPKRLVFLTRCFMVVRFPLDNNKELVIINTHNSTFDKGGMLRKSEFSMLQKVITDEFEKGNYVIAGGDWNMNPRGYKPGMFDSGDTPYTIDPQIESGFLPGWQFVFDPTLPSNRDIQAPYIKRKTKTTIIDFFIISPNIELKTIRTISEGFAYSDHNPLVMSVALR